MVPRSDCAAASPAVAKRINVKAKYRIGKNRVPIPPPPASQNRAPNGDPKSLAGGATPCLNAETFVPRQTFVCWPCQAPQLCSPFGISGKAVVKNKFFQYGADKRLSYGLP